jgi:hypothetical protein
MESSWFAIPSGIVEDDGAAQPWVANVRPQGRRRKRHIQIQRPQEMAAQARSITLVLGSMEANHQISRT